jgi:hypothetical protein
MKEKKSKLSEASPKGDRIASDSTMSPAIGPHGSLKSEQYAEPEMDFANNKTENQNNMPSNVIDTADHYGSREETTAALEGKIALQNTLRLHEHP